MTGAKVTRRRGKDVMGHEVEIGCATFSMVVMSNLSACLQAVRREEVDGIAQC